MESDIQLLVHAGAPSNRSDDDGFIRQARAYSRLVDQNTVRTRRLLGSPWSAVNHNEVIQTSTRQPNDDHLDEPHPDASSFIEDTQLAHTALESQLCSSAITAAHRSSRRQCSTPKFVGTPARTSVAIDAPASNRSAGSTNSPLRLSQSSYLVTPILDRTLRKSPENRGPSSRHAGHKEERGGLEVHVPSTASKIALAKGEVSEESRHDATDQGSRETEETTSELPTSYSLSDGASGNSKTRPQLSERSASDPGTISLPSKERSREYAVMQEYPTSAGLKMPASMCRVDPKPVAHVSPQRQSTSVASSNMIATLSHTIRPPEPEVGTGSFTTHVTETLQQLDSTATIVDRYKPLSVSRDIDALERGHWLIPCSGWGVDHQISFWKMLDNLIGSGSAGWGVWCSRGPELRLEEQAAAKDSAAVTSPQFGPVRVYCWGEVARHIYLMLYVASNSRVRRSGLAWIDSEGQEVIRMPGMKE